MGHMNCIGKKSKLNALRERSERTMMPYFSSAVVSLVRDIITLEHSYDVAVNFSTLKCDKLQIFIYIIK